jgi:hypothetical protein
LRAIERTKMTEAREMPIKILFFKLFMEAANISNPTRLSTDSRRPENDLTVE